MGSYTLNEGIVDQRLEDGIEHLARMIRDEAIRRAPIRKSRNGESLAQRKPIEMHVVSSFVPEPLFNAEGQRNPFTAVALKDKPKNIPALTGRNADVKTGRNLGTRYTGGPQPAFYTHDVIRRLGTLKGNAPGGTIKFKPGHGPRGLTFATSARGLRYEAKKEIEGGQGLTITGGKIVRGGTLRKSIHMTPLEYEGNRMVIEVRASAPYAVHVEFGTARHGEAQPFMLPAVERYAGKNSRIAQALRQSWPRER